MPRQSKSKTDVSETTPAVNTPATSQVEKSTKGSKQVKESKPKEVKSSAPTPVVETPPSSSSSSSSSVVESVSSNSVVDNESNDVLAQSTEFFAKLNQVSSLLASLKTEFRSLEKKWSRELKVAQKSQAKRKRKSGNRQPSGFVKPTKISDELANFLEKPTGTEMARTDVTREINTYIRANKLQDKDNGRKINPDAKLASLLKLKKTDELTYFNLQRYMSPHFSKTEKPVSVTA
jgi:chromatin remodeling complex protein RSC6